MSGTDITGRVALVTGAGSGIGAACAHVLARLGAVVAVADISPDASRRVVASIEEAGGQAAAWTVDVTDVDAVEQMVNGVVREAGALHIAVNNAGVAVPMVPVADVSDEDWRKVMAVNVDGLFYCLRAEVRAMRPNGTGSIINMSSVLGKVSRPGTAAYTASKHAVIGLTRGAALDHGADGVRVNAVGPGFIQTPLLQGRHDAEALEAVTSRWPLRRLGQPEEIGEMVAWLGSDASSFVTGAYFPVDGGYLAC